MVVSSQPQQIPRRHRPPRHPARCPGFAWLDALSPSKERKNNSCGPEAPLKRSICDELQGGVIAIIQITDDSVDEWLPYAVSERYGEPKRFRFGRDR